MYSGEKFRMTKTFRHLELGRKSVAVKLSVRKPKAKKQDGQN